MFENDLAITGRHATYLKFLVQEKLFERYIDVYMNAAIFGLLYNRTAKRDTTSDDRARVYADAFAKERENCMFLYRIVMLLDKTIELSPEERVNRAFRYDSQPDKSEEFTQNMELFHSYIRGGIEVMYEQFTDGCQTQDDYLSKSYETMTMFRKELAGISYVDELSKLIK